MKPEIHLIPTILVKNKEEFVSSVRRYEKDFSFAQIDVMDGKFVTNSSYCDLDEIEKIQTSLLYELHLMVMNPVSYVRKAKGNVKIRKILFHHESDGNAIETAKTIKALGFHAGLVLNPETKIEEAEREIAYVDTLMIMGVHPGSSGQKFLEETVDKVANIHRLYPSLSIEIDGGVTDRTAGKLVEAGAKVLSVGSFFTEGDPAGQKEKILTTIR